MPTPTVWSGNVFPFNASMFIAPGGSLQTNPVGVPVAVPSNGTPTVVTFPTPFASSVLYVGITPESGVGLELSAKVTNVTNNGFSIVCEGGNGSNVNFTWMAVGL